jgi:hypothetical protein
MFFDSLLYDATFATTKSYNQLAIEIKSGHGVEISKQGIDHRFNEGAAKYIESLIGEQVCEQVLQSIDTGWFKHFKRIIIKDSTKFDVSKNLKEKLPGFGGCASEAGACIQYEFDIKSGYVNDLAITPAKRPDVKDSLETINKVRAGDLTIRDMGYFVIDYFRGIQEKKAFFISRLKPKVVVYQKKGNKFEEIDFVGLYHMMIKNNIERLDKQVFIGSDEKFPVRLVIGLIPEEVVAARMQKINKYNKKKGRQTGKDYINKARFNLFITNIPDDTMECEAIANIYKIRWQIELIFKAWKSIFGLDKIGQMKYTRLMCLLNARLLLILINWEALMTERYNLYKKTGQLLSIYKCSKTLKDNSAGLRHILTNGGLGISRWFRWIIEIFKSNHWLEKKKKKIGFEEIMYLNIL